MNDRYYHGRGFWTDIEHAVMGKLTIPGRFFVMSKTPWDLRRSAPLLREHTAEMLSGLGYTNEDAGDASRGGSRMNKEQDLRPLRGIRVIDLTVVWAGLFASMLLGDLGPEAIKVKNVKRMQPQTRGHARVVKREDEDVVFHGPVR